MKEFRKIRICHVAAADITIGFLLMPQLHFLMNQHCEVFTVCSPGKLIKDVKSFEGIEVKTIKISRRVFTPIQDIISLVRLYLYFRKEKFDIVHTHSPKPGLLGQLAARLAGVPIVVNTIHGLYFTEDTGWLKRKIYIFIEKVSAKFSSTIFSQNMEDITTMAKEGIAPVEKIRYLGNGINIEKFSTSNLSPQFIGNKKIELGIPPGSKVIGMVGRLVAGKGYLDLFKAMQIVFKKYPDAFLICIGPDEPEKPDAIKRSIVLDYGIEDNVKFLGQRYDMEELYPLMDVFVLPSHREGFPRSVIEAMAAARPIVVTDIRGSREEIKDGVQGLLVTPKDPYHLAFKTMYLLRNIDYAKNLGRAAKSKAINEYDEQMVFSRLKEEYNNLLVESTYT